MADVSPDTPAEGGKRSAWMAHVKKTMRAHKGKSLSQVLKMAAKTYKHKGSRGTRRGGAALSPALVGGRRGKKGSRKH